jgi:hypothetical protein
MEFRQNQKLIDQERIESIKFKERKVLAESAKRMVEGHLSYN